MQLGGRRLSGLRSPPQPGTPAASRMVDAWIGTGCGLTRQPSSAPPPSMCGEKSRSVFLRSQNFALTRFKTPALFALKRKRSLGQVDGVLGGEVVDGDGVAEAPAALAPVDDEGEADRVDLARAAVGLVAAVDRRRPRIAARAAS